MGNSLFHLKQKQTSVRVEIVAGLTTFLTMAYIIFVNPAILSAAGMDKQALIIVTCIVSAIITIITGLFTNAPIAMAPGMGLNAFLSYSLVKAGLSCIYHNGYDRLELQHQHRFVVWVYLVCPYENSIRQRQRG